MLNKGNLNRGEIIGLKNLCRYIRNKQDMLQYLMDIDTGSNIFVITVRYSNRLGLYYTIQKTSKKDKEQKGVATAEIKDKQVVYTGSDFKIPNSVTKYVVEHYKALEELMNLSEKDFNEL